MKRSPNNSTTMKSSASGLDYQQQQQQQHQQNNEKKVHTNSTKRFFSKDEKHKQSLQEQHKAVLAAVAAHSSPLVKNTCKTPNIATHGLCKSQFQSAPVSPSSYRNGPSHLSSSQKRILPGNVTPNSNYSNSGMLLQNSSNNNASGINHLAIPINSNNNNGSLIRNVTSASSTSRSQITNSNNNNNMSQQQQLYQQQQQQLQQQQQQSLQSSQSQALCQNSVVQKINNGSSQSAINQSKKMPLLSAAKHAIRFAEKQVWNAVAQAQQYEAITKNHFNFHYVVGRGGFGKVWKVEKKKTKKLYAMKQMSKARIMQKRSVNSVMNERKLLANLKHPFLVNMSYAFQDQKNLYLIMDLLNGGDLRFHLAKRKRFSQEQTRFFIACIVLSLEYLHNNGILHRDVKPENLIFDSRGFLRLTDLGIARIWNPQNAQDTSGTPGYMAPQVMCRQNHGVAVDYFATGIIAFQCMMGRRPYLGRSRKQIRDQILAKQVAIKRHQIPDGWSAEAATFINKMIQRKPVNRLGVGGPSQVKLHPWLKDFPWTQLSNKMLAAPYVPSSTEENFDPRSCQDNWKDQQDEESQRQQQELLRRKSIQELFNGYYYDSSIIQTRQTYQSSKNLVTPQTFTTAPSTVPTKSTPLKSSKSPIGTGKTSLSRPQSPTGGLIGMGSSHYHSKGAISMTNSAANSPKSSSQKFLAQQQQQQHHQHKSQGGGGFGSFVQPGHHGHSQSTSSANYQHQQYGSINSNFSTGGGGGSSLSMSSNGIYGYGSSSSSNNNASAFGKHSIPGISSRTLKGTSGGTLRASHIGNAQYRAALQNQQQQSSTAHHSTSNSLSATGFTIGNNQKYLYKGSGKR